jgi:large subunit ribosomal protein L22
MEKDNFASAHGKELSISTKQSVEICNYIRNRKVDDAERILKNVSAKKQAIPFRIYNRDMAHRTGIGPGRYPINAASEILRILKSARSNALNKGLSGSDLVIKTIIANKAASPFHSGRHRGRKMKRTHIKIILSEEKTDKK